LTVHAVPITLWRHLLLELTKMLVITTGIIVTVIAFGAATKSLIENRIGADQAAKYVALATIPMLQYALPFAAGFAATVVLHRFVTDNEVTAMSASGMSYRRILAPLALLGVPLCLVMFLLVAFMAPRIWTKMRDMGAADLTQMMVASVERGEALTLKNLQIYADSVEEVPLPAGAAPKRRLVLRGVVAVELNKRTGGPVT
jgi:lipopolysaccharide export LptBFGC system permease protein LptF